MTTAIRGVSMFSAALFFAILTAIVLSALPAGAAGPGVGSAAEHVASASLPEVTRERVAGTDRYSTSAAISRREFAQGASVVYIARGDEFADALAGGMLTDGPILLVPRCGNVPTAVSTEIARLDPNEVVALGGKNSVCNATLRAAASGRSTDRVAGQDRYDTAAEISDRVYSFEGDAEAAYFASGTAYADAVAGGSLTDGPVLLVRPDGSSRTR